MDGHFPGGGSRALLRALEKAGTHLVSDLLSRYGFDLRDILSEDPPSPKWVLGLVEGLPPESMTAALMRDSEDSYGWTTTDYLSAAVINSIRENTFVNMQVRTKKKLKPIESVSVPGLSKKKENKPVNNFVRMAQMQLAQQTRS